MVKKMLLILFLFTNCLYAQDSIKTTKPKKWSIGIFSSYEKYPTKPLDYYSHYYGYYDLPNLPLYHNYGYGFGISIEKELKRFGKNLNLSLKFAPSYNFKGLYYDTFYYPELPKRSRGYNSTEIYGINLPLLTFVNYDYKKISIGCGLGANIFYNTKLLNTVYNNDNSIELVYEYKRNDNQNNDFGYYSFSMNFSYLIFKDCSIQYYITNQLYRKPYVDPKCASCYSKDLAYTTLYNYDFSKGIFTHTFGLSIKL